MRLISCLLSLTLLFASPFGLARSIPSPEQSQAPGNEALQTPIRLANYSPLVNYQLQCQGCHLAQGEGAPGDGVPRMTGFVGNFLKVEGGREFLIQVPGAALSALTNQQLAGLLNWMLEKDEIAAGSAPKNFTRYNEKEVAQHRGGMLQDLVGHRRALVEKIQDLGIQIPKGADI